jgi:hypothetical protein
MTCVAFLATNKGWDQYQSFGRSVEGINLLTLVAAAIDLEGRIAFAFEFVEPCAGCLNFIVVGASPLNPSIPF